MDTSIPRSKAHLLQLVESLSYNERIAFATKLGKVNKGKPELRALVNELFKHPDPSSPEMDTEDDFTEILPPQRTTIYKHYNEDQLALAIATTAGMFDVFRERLKSPSMMFDSKVISEFVGQRAGDKKEFCATEDEVVKAILEAVPARRSLLMHACARSNRFGVFNKVVPLLQALPIYPIQNIGNIIHLCSSSVVEAFIAEWLPKGIKFHWDKIARFHAKVIVALLRKELADVSEFDRSPVWDRWYTQLGKHWARDFFSNNHAENTAMILDLYEQYPPMNFLRSTSVTIPIVKPGHFEIFTPQIVTGSFSCFARQHQDRLTKLMIRTIYVRHDDRLRHKLDAEFLQGGGVSFEKKMEFIGAYFGKSTSQTLLYQHDSLDLTLLHQIHKLIEPANTAQILQLANYFHGYFQKVQVPPDNISQVHHIEKYRKWVDLCREFLACLLDSLIRSSDVARDNLKDPKLTPKKVAMYKADIVKHGKAQETVSNKFFGWLRENVFFERKQRVSGEPERDLNRQLIALYVATFFARNVDVQLQAKIFEEVKPLVLILTADVRDLAPRKTLAESVFKHITKEKEKQKISEEYDAIYAKYKHDLFQFWFDNLSKAAEADPTTLTFLFKQNKNETFSRLFPIFGKDPVRNIHYLTVVFHKLSLEQQTIVYKYFRFEDLLHMARTNNQVLTTIFFTYLPLEVINEDLTKLLASKDVSQILREQLLVFQDINDPKIRTSLQKMSNSNNITERNAALKSLLLCTARDKSILQITRTLKFLREKLKNESFENRRDVLAWLMLAFETQDSNTHYPLTFFQEGTGEEQFNIWFDLLKDALEAQDLDEGVYDKTQYSSHPILKFFMELANAAVGRAAYLHAKYVGAGFLEFGIELQWRIAVFRMGEKKAANEYKFVGNLSACFEDEDKVVPKDIDEDQRLALRLPGVAKFTDAYVLQLDKRIWEKNPEWKSNTAYFTTLLQTLITKNWIHIPVITNMVKAQIEEVKATAPKDDDGLYIVEADNQMMASWNALKGLRESWDEDPTVHLVDTIMHSRQAPLILRAWVDKKEHLVGEAKTSSLKRAIRTKYITELLQISPSAIHLRFVWRWLVSNKQTLLDNFIGKKKTFRGVFYVAPDKRKLARSANKTPETQRAGGRARDGKKGRGSRARKIVGMLGSSNAATELAKVEEERKKEKEIEDELAGVPLEKRDHEDFFYLEACYGLHRLAPRQSTRLAEDWAVQILSVDRAIPYRVKATARWTIMPTIAYHEVVTFLNTHEKPSAEEQKENKAKPLPVNLIETLLRGVMRNDEPVAPLNFLLSPKFLASDRAKASVYAISQCVPYMPDGGLTSTLKLLLTGKRRTLLKITAYKEVIRLLAQTATDKHLSMILHEWQREDLHRDVRIAILFAAMRFLNSPSARFVNLAWKILEGGAQMSSNDELLTVLLGAKYGDFAPSAPDTGNFQAPRIVEHFSDLQKFSIPTEQQERYAKNVILAIAKTANSDDVRFLGLYCLGSWVTSGTWGIDKEAELLLAAYLKDTSSTTLLYSKKTSEQAIFVLRWSSLLTHFLNVSKLNIAHRHSSNVEATVDVIQTLADRFVSMPSSERKERIHIHNFLSNICSNLLIDPKRPKAAEARLMVPYHITLKDLFFNATFTRAVRFLDGSSDTYMEDALALCHHGISRACVKPSLASYVIDELVSFVPKAITYNSKLWHKFVTGKIGADAKSDIAKTDEYEYILKQITFSLVSYSAKSAPEWIDANPEDTLLFLESYHQYSQNGRKPQAAPSLDRITELLSLLIRNSIKRNNLGKSTYMLTGVKKLFTAILTQYLSSVESGMNNVFYETLGKHLITKSAAEIGYVITDLEMAATVVHHLLLLSEMAYQNAYIINFVNGLYEAAASFSQTLVAERLLPLHIVANSPTADKTFKERAQRAVFDILIARPHITVAYWKPTVVLLDSISASPNPATEEIYSRLNLGANVVIAAWKYSAQQQKIILDLMLNRFLELPKEQEEGYTGKGYLARQIVFTVIDSYCDVLVTFYEGKVVDLAHELIRLSALKLQDISKSATRIKTMLQTLSLKYWPKKGEAGWTGTFTELLLPAVTVAAIESILSSRTAEQTEAGVQVGLLVLDTYPTFVVQDKRSSLAFLNLIIAHCILEPDNVNWYNKTLRIYKDALRSVLTPPEEMAEYINTIVTLKHQSYVFPHQSGLISFDDWKEQYKHYSLLFAVNLLTHYGASTRLPEEHRDVWRKPFIDILDALCDSDDNVVRAIAVKTDVVTLK